jgi:hypothetical protein
MFTESVDIITFACNPALLFVAQVAMGAAQQGAQYKGDKLAAKAKEDYQKIQGDATLEADAAVVSDNQVRLAEYQDKSSSDAEKTLTKATTASATSAVSSMEAGAMGATYEALTEEYHSEIGQLAYAQTVNENIAVGRYLREDAARISQVKGRLVGIHTPIAQAQAGQALLAVGATAMGAAGNYMKEGGTMKNFSSGGQGSGRSSGSGYKGGAMQGAQTLEEANFRAYDPPK